MNYNMMRTLKKYTNRLLSIKTITTLILTTIGLINFGYCSTVEDLIVYIDSFNGTIQSNSFQVVKHVESSSDYGTYCIKPSSFQSNKALALGFNSSLTYKEDWSIKIYPAYIGEYLCMYTDLSYLFLYNYESTSVSISYDVFKLNILLSTELPRMTSLECQRNYGLIPRDDVDQNFCVSNGLCPSSECSGGVSSGSNWSALYINNIQYTGAPTIKVTIPEEIERDDYTDEEETTIDIIGYGYDQEKMQQMVNTQYYKPTAEEMSGLIEKIADFLPLIAVALLITRIRRVIKKVF